MDKQFAYLCQGLKPWGFTLLFFIISGFQVTCLTNELATTDPRLRPQVGEVIVGIDSHDCRKWTPHKLRRYMEEKEKVKMQEDLLD